MVEITILIYIIGFEIMFVAMLKAYQDTAKSGCTCTLNGISICFVMSLLWFILSPILGLVIWDSKRRIRKR